MTLTTVAERLTVELSLPVRHCYRHITSQTGWVLHVIVDSPTYHVNFKMLICIDQTKDKCLLYL